MKRPLIPVLILVVGALAVVAAKLTIPFSYSEAQVDSVAVSHVIALQAKGEQDPEKVATHFLFFHGDYHGAPPDWIQVSSKEIDENTLRVKVYNPRCEDDSISRSIQRVYLRRDESQRWIPVRQEWSHKGRGRFGWTTEPTT
ncbi:MAG: hypothetical protein EOP84_21060 [Verrucomicrobiaceae bacterium]|nr:MAG: hypothetical protein EOP84_21060 [Verrucomicrobiaceae bacterium]